MRTRVFERNLDVALNNYIPILKLKQGEKLTSQLEVSFFLNNLPFDVSTRNISAVFKTPGKDFLYQKSDDEELALDIVQNTVTIVFKEEVMSLSGDAKLEFQIRDAITGQLIILQPISIIIEESIDA